MNINFLFTELEQSPDYMKMITEAQSKVPIPPVPTPRTTTESRPTARSRPELPKIAGKENHRDSLEQENFLNKVCKFELISRGNPKSPSASTGKTELVKSPEPCINTQIHLGEKLFPRDTLTTRISASVLHGSSDRVNSSCSSNSSSSLTSVSSISSDMSSSRDTGSNKAYTHSRKLTDSPDFTTSAISSPLKNGTQTPHSNGFSMTNGDASLEEVKRNTFEGMDFDFNELTASQQDLTIRHREIVTQRKREQEQERLERQRLEEILNMCAEYEQQLEQEKQSCSDFKSIVTNSPLPFQVNQALSSQSGTARGVNQTPQSGTRPIKPPSLLEINLDSSNNDFKDKTDFRSSVSKIKTNGSLTRLSSPNNPPKEGIFGFQNKKSGSSSSNSEEELYTSSENTGTIKRRPGPDSSTTTTTTTSKLPTATAVAVVVPTTEAEVKSPSTSVTSSSQNEGTHDAAMGLLTASITKCQISSNETSNSADFPNSLNSALTESNMNINCNGLSSSHNDESGSSASSTGTLKDHSPRSSVGDTKSMGSGSRTPVNSDSEHSLSPTKSVERPPSSSGVETSSENSLVNIEVSLIYLSY